MRSGRATWPPCERSAASEHKLFMRTAYTYDTAGQRTQEASTVGTRDFSYDDQRQLTSAYDRTHQTGAVLS